MPTIFYSTSELLTSLLDSIKSGKTQLPDFQRGWVWDDERIRRLLVSILQSYPIGAVMLLQTGNPEVNFKPRLLEGVKLEQQQQIIPERLILDGQQRLTSLYQALYTGEPVLTKDSRGNEVERWYYLDIEKCIDPQADKEDAVISVPNDKLVKGVGNQVVADYTTLEKECEAGVLPIYFLFRPADLLNWQTKYFSEPAKLQERSIIWSKLMSGVHPAFTGYQIPVIILHNTTPKEAVCQVFENVNTGGVTLTVFELLTATFAADNFSLRDDWQNREEIFKQNPILNVLESTAFLQAVTLLATYHSGAAVSCKRKDILKLSLAEYHTYTAQVEKGFWEAAKFLTEQKIFSARDLPYATQLVPLAAIFAEIGPKAHSLPVRQKIARWYWCGVFGELYGAAVETRFAKDLPQVVAWLNGGPEPDTVKEAYFNPDRFLTLRTRNSAAYKGIHVLLMREGCQDFLSGVSIDVQMYYQDNVDVHHIFPVDYCKNNGIKAELRDCIVNKSPLSSRTNRLIGGSAPSVYLQSLETSFNLSLAKLDQILSTHLIDAQALRSDDFDAFFEKRREALLQKIKDAMR
jgi:hypothetical protein